MVFLQANFSDVEGENAKVTVIQEEQEECKVGALKGNNVSVKIENTLEYSQMAE